MPSSLSKADIGVILSEMLKTDIGMTGSVRAAGQSGALQAVSA